MPGLQAELRLKNVTNSPLADLSEVIREPVTPLSWVLLHYILTGEKTSKDEFDELLTDGLNTSPQEIRELESNGDEFESTEVKESVCGYLRREAEVVSEVYAVNGSLHLKLEVNDREELRNLCAGIEEKYGPVTIDRLTNIQRSNQTSGGVQVTLENLTDRQYEVLKTAYQMGYFGYPRGANAKDVADALGITSSTVTEHLSTAQSKLLDEIFYE